MDAASGRARDAAQLEVQVGRLRELRLVVEGLIRVGELKDVLEIAEENCRQKSEEQAIANMRNGELRAELSQARARLTKHREQLAELDRSILTAEAEQTRLSAEITRAEKTTELQEQLSGLRTLSSPPTLMPGVSTHSKPSRTRSRRRMGFSTCRHSPSAVLSTDWLSRRSTHQQLKNKRRPPSLNG